MIIGVRSRERPEKILISMFLLAEGTTRLLKYEDIVVTAFINFPEEFALRDYPQYPDSSDIHKPLYGPLKRGGFVRSGNKKFGLTPKGVEKAGSMMAYAKERLALERDGRRISRDVQAELERMLKSAAVTLFAQDKRKKILDTDFYAFVGCTVRTARNDFLGRVATTEQAISKAVELAQPDPAAASLLAAVWSALREDHGTLIARAEAKR